MYPTLISLLESRADFIAKTMGSALLRAAQKDSFRVNDPKAVVDELKAMDPTPNSQYLQWIALQYTRGLFKLEDDSRVRDELTKFHQIKNKLGAQADIGKMSYHELSELVDQHFERVELEVPDANDDEYDVLYNGPLGLLTTPKTQAASCALGSGTKWCTAASEGQNAFSDYNALGPLYIWKDKSGAKCQLHFETMSFMDARDREIEGADLKKLLAHPVISKLADRGAARIVAMSTNQRLDEEEYHELMLRLSDNYSVMWMPKDVLQTARAGIEAQLVDRLSLHVMYQSDVLRYAVAVGYSTPDIEEALLVDEPDGDNTLRLVGQDGTWEQKNMTKLVNDYLKIAHNPDAIRAMIARGADET